jgi:putative MATE family efflux protein
MNRIWSVLKEAVGGSKRDFTQGSIGVPLFILAIPMILEMFMESLFGIVDIFFVAKLKADAVAVVGLTESMLALVFAIAIGLSVGATATVSRRTGENDPEGAARGAVHAIYLGLIVTALISVVGYFYAAPFLAALGAEPEVVTLGTTYTQIMLGTSGVIVFLFLLNAIFRGAGDAAITLRILILANILNIFLAPCFIFGPDIFKVLGINAPAWLINVWPFPHMGVTGAAVGTTIGRGAGLLLAIYYLIRPGGRITIKKHHWKIDTTILRNLTTIVGPAIIQFTIGTASWSVLVRVVSGFGSEAIAGYVIGLRVIMFVLLPAVGLSNAAATLVGQNLGAAKPERAEASVWRAAYINAIFLGLTGLFVLIFSHNIVGWFTSEPEVLKYGAQSLHIVAFGFVFYAFGMVLEAAFNGAGDTWTPTWLNLLCFWMLEIPLAYLLSYKFGMGPSGVFWSITIAFSVLAIVSTLVFKRGKWKLKEV